VKRLFGHLVVVTLAVLFCAAPVPGDIGGCAQARQELDPDRFFGAKAYIDCQRCGECGLRTQACAQACAGGVPNRVFPSDCRPLVHDGQVCLRALQSASCDDYGNYASDTSPTVPTECDFCPIR
jgi:hypothetical protein